MTSDPSTSKVKRKPPPPFPYSPLFPEPDPDDPFVPISVLRARAKASTVTLVNPSTDSHDSHHHYAQDARRTHFLPTPDRTATDMAHFGAEQHSRPWYGYLSDVSKPLRPPRSRKRPSAARETTYVSDHDDGAHGFAQAFSYVRQPRTVAPPEVMPKERRGSVQYSQDSQYHYRRRSQSVLLPSNKRTSTTASALGTKANVSESAQDALAYGERQSHGYAYADFDGGVFQRHGSHERMTSVETESSRSRFHSDASTHSPATSTGPSAHDIHRTPSMTADDTFSSPSTSPLPDQIFAHQVDPLSSQAALRDILDDQSVPAPLPKDDVVLRTNRDTIVAYDSNRATILADPPLTRRRSRERLEPTIAIVPTVTEPSPVACAPQSEEVVEVLPPSKRATNAAAFSMPTAASTSTTSPSASPSPSPSPVPPSPVHEDHFPPSSYDSHSADRHVESDPEVNTRGKKYKRTGSLSEARKKLQKPRFTSSGVRGKVISNPIPIHSATTRTPSIVVPNNVEVTPQVRGEGLTQSNTLLAATAPLNIQRLALIPGGSALSDTEAGNRHSRLLVPKPKKSLSHVNLRLKVLPNTSLAPTIVPSANTSNCSAVGNLSIVKSKTDEGENRTKALLRAQTEPAASYAEPRPETRRAQTIIPRVGQEALSESRAVAPLRQASSSDSESMEDLAAYSILSYFNLVLPLSPVIPLATSTPAGTSHAEPEECVQGPPPRMPSPVPADEEHTRHIRALQIAKRSTPLPELPRRDSDQGVPRVSSMLPPRTESPVPRAVSPASRSAPQRGDSTISIPQSRYRNSAPPPLSIPPRAKSPIAAQLHGSRYEIELEAQEVIVPPRAASPAPVPLKSKAIQDVLQISQREDDERMSQRSRGSRGSRDREETGYLPVAQLPHRATPSRQQTGQSQSSSRRSTVSRAHSTQMMTPTTTQSGQARSDVQARPRAQSPSYVQPRAQSPSQVQPRAQSPSQIQPRAQSPSQVQPRVRSPEPMRVPVKAKTLPAKDLDSPLPPPPVEVRSVQTDTFATPATIRSFGHPTRAATAPEVTSPMVFVTPPELLSPEPPRRQYTEPLPDIPDDESPALTIQSTPGYLTEHDLSHQTHASSSRAIHTYPPDWVTAIPTKEKLATASNLWVVAESGLRVPFGDLFKDRKVIVIFIRHFWCPLCQDYMYSISREVDIEALKRAGIHLVVIGNGSAAMIKSYRRIFRMPYPLYTDPTLRLHKVFGMTGRTATDQGAGLEKGEYVRHGVIGGMAMVVLNALRSRMPVWENGGNPTQLGGEFVLGPGLSCSYAHRMKTTRDHAPILDVLAAAGLRRQTFFGRIGEMAEPWSPEYRSIDKKTADRSDSRLEYTPRIAEQVPYGYLRVKGENSRTDWSLGGAAISRYGGEDLDADADTEEDRSRANRKLQPRTRTRSNNLKKGVRNYRVANPDRKHHPAPRIPSTTFEKHDLWCSPASARVDEFGARKQEYDSAYMLTHEVLSYSFGVN